LIVANGFKINRRFPLLLRRLFLRDDDVVSRSSSGSGGRRSADVSSPSADAVIRGDIPSSRGSGSGSVSRFGERTSSGRRRRRRRRAAAVVRRGRQDFVNNHRRGSVVHSEHYIFLIRIDELRSRSFARAWLISLSRNEEMTFLGKGEKNGEKMVRRVLL